MGSPRPRAAALVIGVHLDEGSEDGWYAILEAYDDLDRPRHLLGSVTNAEDLTAVARRWLDTVLAAPRSARDGE